MGETKETLFGLAGQYLELLDLASDPYTDPELLKETMEGLLGEIETKTDGYCAVITALQNRLELYKAEAARMTNLAKYIENNIADMKYCIKSAMEAMEITEIDGTYNKLKIVKNGGKQKVEYTGEIPDNYKRIVYEADTEKIRKALEAGEKLDFAYLAERGTHLKIN